jgi:uncharacterized protein YbjT (DUF2867 family)
MTVDTTSSSRPAVTGTSAHGRVLVLGSTGTTGSRVAEHLERAGAPVLRASRSPKDGYVVFDWLDESTWGNVLGQFDRIYLVPPIGVPDPRPVVQPFLAAAVDAGVQRAVLLSSSAVEPADTGLGALHTLVTDAVPEWAVLRPSWFMQNFTGDLAPAHGVRRGSVVTATQGGRIGFIDADDIAAVATELLLQSEPPQRDYILTGPDALSFADVCDIATDVLGRDVTVEDVAPEQFADYLVESGVPREFALVLARLDVSIAEGGEDRVTDAVEQIARRRPTDMRTYLSRTLPSSP